MRPPARAADRSWSTAEPAPRRASVVGHPPPSSTSALLANFSARSTCCSTTSIAVPLRLIASQTLVDGIDNDGRQTQRELVGDKELRRHDQHLGQREQALLAPRKRPRGLLAALAQNGKLLVGPREVLRHAGAAGALAEDQHEVLLDGEAGEDTPALHHVGHAQPGDPPGGHPGHVGPAKRTEPSVAVTRPVIVRATVDLPAPFDPISATTPPAGTLNDTSKSARYGP